MTILFESPKMFTTYRVVARWFVKIQFQT